MEIACGFVHGFILHPSSDSMQDFMLGKFTSSVKSMEWGASRRVNLCATICAMPKIVDANTRTRVLELTLKQLKNREIAKLCEISPRMVSKIRAEEASRLRRESA